MYQIPKLKCFSSRLALVLAQSIEARCSVENVDVVGTTPTDAAPTTSEWSTILPSTKVPLISEVWEYHKEHWRNQYLLHPTSDSMEISFHFDTTLGYGIISYFRKCHDRTAVKSCEKIGSNWLIRIWTKVKLNFHPCISLNHWGNGPHLEHSNLCHPSALMTVPPAMIMSISMA